MADQLLEHEPHLARIDELARGGAHGLLALGDPRAQRVQAIELARHVPADAFGRGRDGLIERLEPAVQRRDLLARDRLARRERRREQRLPRAGEHGQRGREQEQALAQAQPVDALRDLE